MIGEIVGGVVGGISGGKGGKGKGGKGKGGMLPNPLEMISNLVNALKGGGGCGNCG